MSETLEAGSSARGSVERARLLIEAGRAADAMPLLHQAIAADPHDGEARCLLAYAYYRLGDWRAALEASEEAAVCDPHDEWSHRVRALALLELKQNRKALLAAQEAVRLDPHGPYTLKILARCQLENGKRREARQTANLLREIAPDWADSHETLGYVALIEQKWKEAEQHYRRALELDPQSWSAMNDLALSLQRQRRHKEAVELFHRAAQLRPGEPLARQNLFSSVQGYLGGGFAVLWLTGQFVQHAAPLFRTLPPSYHPWLRAAVVLVVVAAIVIPIWHRRRRLAEIHPTVLSFYRDEQQRMRRKSWEQFAVVGGLGAGVGICLIWWSCGWAYGNEKMGLQGVGATVFGTVAVATVAGFICLLWNWKRLSARWKAG